MLERTPHAATWLMAIAAGLALAGCSDEGMSQEEFRAQFAPAYCGLVFRCCAPADATRLFEVPIVVTSPEGTTATAGTCTQGLQEELQRYSTVMMQGLAPISYDSGRASRCMNRLSTFTCADLARWRVGQLSPDLECNSVYKIQGYTPSGARCGQPYDCAPGLACDQPGDDEPGICKPIGQVPGACPDCPAGQFCDATTDGKCVAGAADGAVCTFDQQCTSTVCWGGDPRASMPGTCGLPAAICRNAP